MTAAATVRTRTVAAWRDSRQVRSKARTPRINQVMSGYLGADAPKSSHMVSSTPYRNNTTVPTPATPAICPNRRR